MIRKGGEVGKGKRWQELGKGKEVGRRDREERGKKRTNFREDIAGRMRRRKRCLRERKK